MSYPAKILLFGEHTVLRGGKGLAVPYPQRSLRWVKDRPDERLLSFCDYLRVAIDPKLFDAGALEDQLLADWRLVGDIPTGYGLGSSGAVCAAIWSRFATSKGFGLRGEALRQVLARMEQHFHGSSSGTDPLICYLNQPLTLGGGSPPRTVDLPNNWYNRFFLVDTGQTREAAHYIKTFTSRYDQDSAFASQVDAGWRSPADACIEAVLAGEEERLRRHFTALSNYQLEAFPDFIPTNYRTLWKSDSYLLKLCGAGGGGMLLGYLMDVEKKAAVAKVFGKVEWLHYPV